MKYLWFREDDFGFNKRSIYRIQEDPAPTGERWDDQLRAWVFAEKPVREYFLGPDYLSAISLDEARALLPAEAMPEWRGKILFKLFAFEIVRVREKRSYSWGVPQYEAKDPNPEPTHVVRTNKTNHRFHIWQSWRRENNRWQVDWKTTRTKKYRGFPICLISDEIVRDLLPYRAFTDLPYWHIRLQVVKPETSPGRLIGKWNAKTPPTD